MKCDIFLSHAGDNRVQATQAKADLVREGYTVFIDYEDMARDQVTKDTVEQ